MCLVQLTVVQLQVICEYGSLSYSHITAAKIASRFFCTELLLGRFWRSKTTAIAEQQEKVLSIYDQRILLNSSN